MAELVDASDSKSGVRKDVQVRFLFWAQLIHETLDSSYFQGFFFLSGTILTIICFPSVILVGLLKFISESPVCKLFSKTLIKAPFPRF